MELRSPYILFANEHMANYAWDFTCQQQDNMATTRLFKFW
jgi:hypothetical protein